MPLALGEKQPKLYFACTGIWDLLLTISFPASSHGLRAMGALSRSCWTQEQVSLGPSSPVPCPAASASLRSKGRCVSLHLVLGMGKDSKDASSFIF